VYRILYTVVSQGCEFGEVQFANVKKLVAIFTPAYTRFVSVAGQTAARARKGMRNRSLLSID
jgi:hypothetical protein